MNRFQSRPHFVLLSVAIVWLSLLTNIQAMQPDSSADSIVWQDPNLHHLRLGNEREWLEFPEQAEAPSFASSFTAQANTTDATLRLRQQDVKQPWDVVLNDQPLGQLVIDENDMIVYFDIPAGLLAKGENLLQIKQPTAQASVDDIRVGELVVYNRPRNELLHEATLQVQVKDTQLDRLTPCRITLFNEQGSLQTVGAFSDSHTAVRPGIVYTSNGQAQFGLPAGRYTIFVGRGFEYSMDSQVLTISPGQTASIHLEIQREVATPGYVACDTHVHTRTHSGHGDATVQERMVTLAAEGIELPVATDHNVNIDHRPFAEVAGVQQYFTPVIGNEVTTKIGHFNVFPIAPDAAPPNYRLEDWESIFAEIYQTPGVEIAILNHGRDLHSGVRPLGPKLHNSVVGENLQGWKIGMNAMEVVNSSATQTDPMQLLHDWFGLLNRGYGLTPVGSSDSHDVGRHFVGQGRTYIRAPDEDPGNIDIQTAVRNFAEGRVLVSYGLLVDMLVNDQYSAGDLVTVTTNDEQLEISIQVSGPHWVDADSLFLFANGELIREHKIVAPAQNRPSRGVIWRQNWTLDKPKHDVHLVAVASGPGIDQAYWRTAKPYQPDSAEWEPRVLACTGSVWLDIDGDGRRTSAFDYAQQAMHRSQGDLEKLLLELQPYDAAVAAQAASLYQAAGGLWLSDSAQQALRTASASTRSGVQQYLDAWRLNQLVNLP
ncbi:MAG: CehA/McbA family metallohydrolase [bacterium]|nr:CehA/McbA family metallohydrolase [bacterium]